VSVTFGYDGLPGDADYSSGRTFLDAWKRATDLGGPQFTSIWVSDHLQEGAEARFEAISRLSYLAASFPNHALGTLVIGQGYRNPALLAKTAATAHFLSGGRIILGIGAGWHEEEHVAYGYGFPSPGTRVEQLEEAIQILKGMWQGGPFSFQGRHYEVTDAYCIPKPDPPIELLVGTNGTKALKLTATYADAWNWDPPMNVYGPPLEKLREHCRTIGRDPKEIRLTASVDLDLPDDPTQFDASHPVAYLTSQRIGPTPEAAIEQLAPLVTEGVDHFMIGASTFQTLERFANEVAPELAKER
jgi:alkanesulfonate monooxygenase SsuD/methylene tetrahydromethanopterin reductase-like flavin-dependent oxidoreductase (luciferase family)